MAPNRYRWWIRFVCEIDLRPDWLVEALRSPTGMTMDDDEWWRWCVSSMQGWRWWRRWRARGVMVMKVVLSCERRGDARRWLSGLLSGGGGGRNSARKSLIWWSLDKAAHSLHHADNPGSGRQRIISQQPAASSRAQVQHNVVLVLSGLIKSFHQTLQCSGWSHRSCQSLYKIQKKTTRPFKIIYI